MIFVIDRRDCTLRYQGGCLILQRKDKKDRQIPIQPLEQVIIYGNPLVEASVFRALAGAGVPVMMLAARGKQPFAICGGGLAVQLPLRRRQHRLAGYAEGALNMARWFVIRKMENYDLPLAVLGESGSGQQADLDDFRRLRDQSVQKLHSAGSHASILGIEGRLAHAWFALLAKQLPYKWKFAGRNRRPPRDPVNALLSLGYTLLLSEVTHGVGQAGLDPSLGFLHRDYPGRESLALDFTEIFRSGVDCFVLALLHSEKLECDSFYYRKTEGCRMSKAARSVFYQNWGHYREAWPRREPLPDQRGAVRYGPLREYINGQVMEVRNYMKQLEKEYGITFAETGNDTGCAQSDMA
ncbi:MAG: CRISPR-associated endonuclease Cas1 [Gammaproteobacteria bacterium]|nr:MAG: CRISPR-associated endonuclease Cas1 [Gammaproteobacteria bacterium]